MLKKLGGAHLVQHMCNANQHAACTGCFFLEVTTQSLVRISYNVLLVEIKFRRSVCAWHCRGRHRNDGRGARHRRRGHRHSRRRERLWSRQGPHGGGGHRRHHRWLQWHWHGCGSSHGHLVGWLWSVGNGSRVSHRLLLPRCEDAATDARAAERQETADPEHQEEPRPPRPAAAIGRSGGCGCRRGRGRVDGTDNGEGQRGPNFCWRHGVRSRTELSFYHWDCDGMCHTISARSREVRSWSCTPWFVTFSCCHAVVLKVDKVSATAG